MLSVGIDVVEIGRIEKTIDRFGGRFLDRIYTDYERALCDHGNGKARAQRYAGYWAAKEATMKALGTGNRKGVAYKDIETRHEPSGKPYIVLYGAAKSTATNIGVKQMAVSISHEKSIAGAVAVLT